jgi:hypothetical protein
MCRGWKRVRKYSFRADCSPSCAGRLRRALSNSCNSVLFGVKKRTPQLKNTGWKTSGAPQTGALHNHARCKLPLTMVSESRYKIWVKLVRENRCSFVNVCRHFASTMSALLLSIARTEIISQPPTSSCILAEDETPSVTKHMHRADKYRRKPIFREIKRYIARNTRAKEAERTCSTVNDWRTLLTSESGEQRTI